MTCRSEPAAARLESRRPGKPVLTPREFASFAHLPGWVGANEPERNSRPRPHERFAVYVRAAPWPQQQEHDDRRRRTSAASPLVEGWAGYPYGVGKDLYVRVSVWRDWEGRPFVLRVWDADDAYLLGPGLPTAYAANEAVNELVRAAPLTTSMLYARGFTL